MLEPISKRSPNVLGQNQFWLYFSHSRSCCLVVVALWLGFLFFSPTTGFAAHTQGSKSTISQIDFIGLNALSARDILNGVNLEVGDLYEKKNLESIEQLLVKNLEQRGFFQAQVQAHVEAQKKSTNYSIVFHIQEGTPCRIQSLDYTSPSYTKSKFELARINARIRSALSFKEKDRYDEFVFSQRLQKLRDLLISEDFLAPNVDKVNLRFNEDRTQVEVKINIEYGDRVTFGFLGNTVFNRGELVDILKKYRQADVGKEYVSYFAREIEKQYKNKAYYYVRVIPEISERQHRTHVTFQIQEGIRARIESLDLEGLSDASQEREEEKFKELSPRLLQRGYYVDSFVDSTAEQIADDLKSQGFLSSKYIGKTVIPGRRPGFVKLLVQFYQGSVTLVDSVDTKGVFLFSKEEVQDLLGQSPGNPFNPFQLEGFIQALRLKYLEAGHLDVEILNAPQQLLTYSSDFRRVGIHIQVKEGPEYHLRSIHFEGLSQTKESVVRREVEDLEGKLLKQSVKQEIEERLRNLGIFHFVVAKIQMPSSSEEAQQPSGSLAHAGAKIDRDILVQIQESDPGFFELIPGFRSDLGAKFLSRLGYNNLFGRNKSITLSAGGNRRFSRFHFFEYTLESAFLDPRLFGSKLSFSSGVSTQKRQYFDFNAVQTQFFTYLERGWSKKFSTRLTYRLERIRQFGALDALDNQSLFIGTLAPSLVLDTRDQPLTPTKGQISNASFELALPAFAGAALGDKAGTGYYRTSFSSHHYWGVSDILFSQVIAGGYEKNLMPRFDAQHIPTSPIPLIKTFRLGGYSNLRGFREDSLNYDSKPVGGGLAFLNFRSQVDWPFSGDFKLATFVDAGNLYLNSLKNSPFLRVTAGFGFHFFTPIGPVNFDYGFKLNRQDNESLSRFHFSVGVL